MEYVLMYFGVGLVYFGVGLVVALLTLWFEDFEPGLLATALFFLWPLYLPIIGLISGFEWLGREFQRIKRKRS